MQGPCRMILKMNLSLLTHPPAVNVYFLSLFLNLQYFYRAALPLPQWGPALDFHRNFAGYLPAGFTPQPYRMGQRPNPSDPIQQESSSRDQQNMSKDEVDPEATLPASTPMLGLTLCSTETTL